MKTWKAQVCLPMWQEMMIDAENAEEAKATMLDLFDLVKADPGEAYVYDLTEVEGESK